MEDKMTTKDVTENLLGGNARGRIRKIILCRGCDKPRTGFFKPKKTHYWCRECFPRYRYYLRDTNCSIEPEEDKENPRVVPVGGERMKRNFGTIKGLLAGLVEERDDVEMEGE